MLLSNLDPFLATLKAFWSRRGFHNLLASNLLRDIAESIQTGGDGVFDDDEILSRASSYAGTVSFGQFKKLLNQDIFPDSDGQQFAFFVSAFMKLSRKSAGWWDVNSPTWEKRDFWRKQMRLPVINPVATSENGLQVVFKRCGHDSRWVIDAPIRYRHATFEEVKSVVLFEDEMPGIALKIDGAWHQTKNEEEKVPLGKQIFTLIPNPEGFFHNCVVFVPFVRL